MPMKPFCRNVEGGRVSYDVLSSKKTFYYTVNMLGEVAIDCECDRFVKGHAHCKHQIAAETEEKRIQSVELPTEKKEEKDIRSTASLHNARAFSFLR